MTRASDPRRRAPGAGRKPRSTTAATTSITVRLTAKESARLDAMATECGCSRVDVLRRALREPVDPE